MMMCAVIPSCKQEPLMVDAEKDNAAAPGLFGSYLQIEPGAYEVVFNEEGTEACIDISFKTINAVEAGDVEVKIALLDADHKEICDMESEDKAFEKALGQAGETFAIKFSTGVDEEKIKTLRESAKFVAITEAEGAVTYKVTGTIAGKPVEGVYEINTRNGKIKGGYHYGSGTSQELIAVKGKYDKKDSSISIVETYNGMETGRWAIKLEPGANCKFVGKMTNYRGNTYEVDMAEDKSLGHLKVPYSAFEGDDEVAAEVEVAEEPDSAGSDDIDEFLDEYQEVLMSLKALSRKAANGDMSAIEAYQEVLEKASSLAEKGNANLANMSSAQRKRFEEILQRASDF